MSSISKFGNRIKMTFLGTMSATVLICIIGVPFIKNHTLRTPTGYYTVSVNGKEVGAANSVEDAEEAVAVARKSFSQDYANIIYMDCNVDVVEEDKIFGKTYDVEELSELISDELYDCVIDISKDITYTVRFDDATVTLATRGEVIELMEKLVAKYDPNGEYSVDMSNTGVGDTVYNISYVRTGKNAENYDIITAALNGTTDGNSEVTSTPTSIYFEQEVTVTETKFSDNQVLSVDEAYNELTKETEEKGIYYVESGDSLIAIAKMHGLSLAELLEMNEGLAEDSLIVPGDAITVTVPKSLVNVITTQIISYEEDYEAEPTYIDNDSEYRGTNTVLEEGTTGHRHVTAEITYSNGNECTRVYRKETIDTEAKAAVISVGTLTPPTYIKPCSGTFSSGFGTRDGGTHYGVDWYCAVGTSVVASCDGIVTRAGYYSDYGYCVDITHSDGSMTRYAHNSSLQCKVGDTVSQGEVIALSGNTGNSSGPHVHFELWIDGVRVNPLNYVDKN